LTVTATKTPTLTPTATFTATPPGGEVVIYPNPVAGGGSIMMHVPLTAPADVEAVIFTLAFRKVQWTVLGQVPPVQDVELKLLDHWGAPLADGLYYVVVKAQGKRWVAKLLVIR
jgi:hypothetical protein